MSHESKPLKLEKAPEPSLRLRKLFAEFEAAGVALTRDEVVWLTLLCRDVEQPLECGVPWLAGSPVVYGASIFWPLTRLARGWFQCWYPKFKTVPEVSGWMYLYASACSDPGNVLLRELSDWHQIHKAVVLWSESVAWPVEQLLAVLDKVLTLNGQGNHVPDPMPKKAAEAVNLDTFNTVLTKAYPGTTPDYWETCVSIVKQDQLVRSLRSLHHENGSNPDSPMDQALEKLYAAKKWLRKWHTGSFEAPKNDVEQKQAKGAKGEAS